MIKKDFCFLFMAEIIFLRIASDYQLMGG